MRIKLFSGDQYKLADYLGTYQATISNMKTGSRRNMWPTVEQIKALCKVQNILLDDVKDHITRVRFGNLTILEKNEEMIEYVFNRESLCSSIYREGKYHS